MTLGLGAILFRLVVLQVRDASAYQSMAREQRIRTIELPPTRGAILDRNGHSLAMSLPAKAVYADPQLIRHPEKESVVLARALHLDPGEVERTITDPEADRFVYIARGVDPEVARSLARKNLAGIGFLDESRRHYPAGALAPQVLGFVGTDGAGLEGVEFQYERALAGRPGHAVVELDPHGTLIPQGANLDVPPVPGRDLVLTIDKDIQYRAQQALMAAVKANHAKGGTVLVMDPRTGDILAMATYPWFDPNEFAGADPKVRRNRAATDVYEPGSVNKVITAAAAVEERVIKLNDRLSVPDQYQLYDRLYHDAHPHATQMMTLGDIITHSSNVGTIKVASMIGANKYSAYLKRFGFGRPTGLGFPGESGGILPPLKDWSGVDIASFPLGQGLAVTPMQMASVYATIANGGVWIRPRLVRGTVTKEGTFAAAPPAATRRVVSEQTAIAVTRMLASAVEIGTGTAAQIPGFWVAGKTGTARKPFENAAGYSDQYVASFIGFAPASDPALVVAAVLDEPATVFGGVASAPLFKDVTRFALARLRIPPAAKPPLPPSAVRAA